MSIDQLFATVQRALAGQYSLEREIGRGGMGVVYLAREVELARLVALKVLPPDLAENPGVRERFLREARTAAGLSHPHVVPIHRVADAGEFVYFSMMYVDGETLGERLRTRGPLSASAATRMLREVSQALAYAHGRGIVHRDIKPDNILLERESGRALVTDFGIAGEANVGPSTGDPVMGTIHYMSPEQAAGLPLDGRSDLYSLGVVAHVTLSGRLPSSSSLASRSESRRQSLETGDVGAAAGDASGMRGVPERAAGSLAVASPTTPRHLVAAIDRALAEDPAVRFASAEAFAGAVDQPTISRQALPDQIRTFLAASDPWRLPYVAWSVGWLLAIGFETGDLFFVTTAVIMSLAPVIPASVFEMRAARRLLEAGYSLDDVRRAFPSWEAERREELDAEESDHPEWVPPVARTVAWTLAGTVGLTITPLASEVIGSLRSGGEMVLAATVFAGAAALPLLNALGIPILPRFMRKARSLRARFWNTTIGRNLSDEFLGRRRALPPANAFRPTELALGSAITDLWRALPGPFREHLDDVPRVVERLEAHATNAREILMRLEEDSASTAEVREIAPARERARHELESAVSALESIRLDLLRLLGGDADLAPMTTVLDAARRVGTDLERLSEAQREVERVIRPIGLDLRPSTPV